MDAADFFRDVVKPNYEAFCVDQNQLQGLWNAVVSMNTVAEYVALDRLGYEDLNREKLDKQAHAVREGNPILLDLKVCADTLKHVRKLERKVRTEVTSILSSTGILSNQPTTGSLVTRRGNMYYRMYCIAHSTRWEHFRNYTSSRVAVLSAGLGQT